MRNYRTAQAIKRLQAGYHAFECIGSEDFLYRAVHILACGMPAIEQLVRKMPDTLVLVFYFREYLNERHERRAVVLCKINRDVGGYLRMEVTVCKIAPLIECFLRDFHK